VREFLDLPVGACDGEEADSGERPQEQAMAGRGGGRVILLAYDGDLSDRADAGEGMASASRAMSWRIAAPRVSIGPWSPAVVAAISSGGAADHRAEGPSYSAGWSGADPQALRVGPGADQVQGRPAVLAVERAPRGLAVERGHTLGPLGESPQIVSEAGLLDGGVEQAEVSEKCRGSARRSAAGRLTHADRAPQSADCKDPSRNIRH
jgi:hypothetical protein